MSRNQNRAGTVYELFAALGLDASGLDQGLAEAKVKLEAFREPVQGVQAQLEQLSTALNPRVLTAALDQIGVNAKVATAKINELYLAAQMLKETSGPRELVSTNPDIVSKLTANAEASRYSALLAQQMGIKKQLEAEEAASLIEAQRVAKARESIEAEEIASRSNYVNLINQLAVEERQANEKALNKESVEELARITAVRKAELAKGLAAEKEAAQLRKQYMMEEQQTAASHKEIWSAIANADRMRTTAAQRAADEEERILEGFRRRQQVQMDRLRAGAPGGAGGISGTGGIGFRGTAVEIQAADQLLGIHIPRGLTSVIAQLGIVQTAMSAAFSAFAAIAFVEILGQVGSKLHDLGDEMTGFGEAATKAWDAAYEGSRKSLLELANYEVQMGRIYDSKGSKKPLGTKLEELNDREGEIKALRQSQIDSRQDAMNKLKELGFSATPGLDNESTLGESLFKLVPSGGYEKYAQGAVTLGDAVEKLRKRYSDLTENIYGLTKSLEDLERQKDRDISKDESASRDKKRRDAVHEYPNRLPWFLGPSPSDFFMQSLEGAPARKSNFIPQPPVLKRENLPDSPSGRNPIAGLMPGGGDVNFTPGGGGLSGKTASIQVDNHYSPVLRFDGVPADMQKTVRDQIIPMIHADYETNQRAATDNLVRVLKNAGVATNV